MHITPRGRERGPPRKSRKAQRSAKSHKDRTEMMMAPSNLMGLPEKVGESGGSGGRMR